MVKKRNRDPFKGQSQVADKYFANLKRAMSEDTTDRESDKISETEQATDFLSKPETVLSSKKPKRRPPNGPRTKWRKVRIFFKDYGQVLSVVSIILALGLGFLGAAHSYDFLKEKIDYLKSDFSSFSSETRASLSKIDITTIKILDRMDWVFKAKEDDAGRRDVKPVVIQNNNISGSNS